MYGTFISTSIIINLRCNTEGVALYDILILVQFMYSLAPSCYKNDTNVHGLVMFVRVYSYDTFDATFCRFTCWFINM